MTGVAPYRIDVPEAVLADLRERLARTRWPDAIDGAGWNYGFDLDYARELCEYWRTDFDWRAQEAELNRLPHFRCEVDGLDQHFWHVRGNGPDPVPLLLFPAKRSWVEQRVNLVRWTEMPSGGHFGALERPGLVVDDLRTFFRELR